MSWDTKVYQFYKPNTTRHNLAQGVIKMKSEHMIQNEIRLALANQGHLVFRTNVGKVKTADGRWFDTGLPIGFPDLFVIKKNGKFCGIEVKNQKGKVRETQQHFSETVLKPHQVIHGVARSVEDATKIVEEELVGYGYKEGES